MYQGTHHLGAKIGNHQIGRMFLSVNQRVYLDILASRVLSYQIDMVTFIGCSAQVPEIVIFIWMVMVPYESLILAKKMASFSIARKLLICPMGIDIHSISSRMGRILPGLSGLD
jgi:hypothetical protein